MELSDFKSYLKEGLGLSVIDKKWSDAAGLPLFLSKAADYRLCSCGKIDFIVAQVEGQTSLPELKRLASQVSVRAGLHVVLAAQIDARQRKALVAQGIPFVVPGRQAFIPFLGFAASSKREEAPLAKVLAPGAQGVLVTLIANPQIVTSEALIETTGMPSSSVSRALDDLSRRGLIEKSKKGREVIIGRDENKNVIIKMAVDCLQNPVVRSVYARKNLQTERFPLAGESQLSERSMLAAPKIEQRAVSKKAFASCAFDEILAGEAPDNETVEIQVWSYDPLVAGRGQIDDVSLALSLIEEGDERVIGQINALFKEELWE